MHKINDVCRRVGAGGIGSEIRCERGGIPRAERHLLSAVDNTVVVRIDPGDEISWPTAKVTECQLLPSLPDALHLTETNRLVGSHAIRLAVPIRIYEAVDLHITGGGIQSGLDDVVVRVHEPAVGTSPTASAVFPQVSIGIDKEALHKTRPLDLFGAFERAGIEEGLINGPFSSRRGGQH